MQRQNELQNIRNSVSRTIAGAIKNCGVCFWIYGANKWANQDEYFEARRDKRIPLINKLR